MSMYRDREIEELREAIKSARKGKKLGEVDRAGITARLELLMGSKQNHDSEQKPSDIYNHELKNAEEALRASGKGRRIGSLAALSAKKATSEQTGIPQELVQAWLVDRRIRRPQKRSKRRQ